MRDARMLALLAHEPGPGDEWFWRRFIDDPMHSRVDHAPQEHFQPGAVELGSSRRPEQYANHRDVVERRHERDDPIWVAYEGLRSRRFD
jgi:hypothetical protein